MRRSRRNGLMVMVGGAALAAAGVTIIVIAIAVGQPGVLTGAATQVPASVGRAAPGLASEAGRPLPASTPVRVEIPALDVDAPLISLGMAANGSVEVPPLYNHNLAGWYNRTVTPGQDGTSVILGHVDTFTGPSVFFYIKTLRPGDLIKVLRADGRVATFAVDGVQEVSKATFPSSIIYQNTRYPELRLITCGGPFDTTTRQYLDNIVVYSHLVK